VNTGSQLALGDIQLCL